MVAGFPTPKCNFASPLATHLTSLHRPPTRSGMPSEEAILENHNTLFLLDGNVLLSAPSSENSDTVFRVHQSLLMRHSGFFQNLLSDVDALEKRDGMPSLRLSIPAERVECLLQYIYGDLCVFFIIPLTRTLNHFIKLAPYLSAALTPPTSPRSDTFSNFQPATTSRTSEHSSPQDSNKTGHRLSSVGTR